MPIATVAKRTARGTLIVNMYLSRMFVFCSRLVHLNVQMLNVIFFPSFVQVDRRLCLFLPSHWGVGVGQLLLCWSTKRRRPSSAARCDSDRPPMINVCTRGRPPRSRSLGHHTTVTRINKRAQTPSVCAATISNVALVLAYCRSPLRS